jgi:hypothetical protein
VAVAEGRDAGDDDGQRQCLKEQVQGAGLDMLAEEKEPKQARP